MSQANTNTLERGLLVLTFLLLLVGLTLRIAHADHHAGVLEVELDAPGGTPITTGEVCPYACCVSTGGTRPFGYRCPAQY